MPTSVVLSRRALNRATLARQHLLEQASMPATAMIEHLVGMQAQVPQQPYVALWSRLRDFRAAELEEAMLARETVRIPSIRTTIHLQTARDALRMRGAVQDVLARTLNSTSFGKAIRDLDVEELLRVGRALMDDGPKSTKELGSALRQRWPDHDGISMAQAIHYLLPVLQSTPRGLWSTTGAPKWTTIETWLGQPLGDPHPVDQLVVRYLAAFGPATVADARIWSWLTGLREVFEGLRPRLVTFRDERGRELFDLPEAPRPPEDSPAPVRFLPEYDNIALSHDDRSRIFVPEAAGRITGWVGTFTIDGFISGQWRLDKTGRTATLVLDPFVPLTSPQRSDLMDEATRLAAFAAPVASDRLIEFGVAREPALGGATIRTGAPPS